MSKLTYAKNRIKRLVSQILSLLPTALPVGMTSFEAWADSIVELSGPYADKDSMRFALASMIMSLGPQRSSVPKNYFVRSLRKAAANQVASQFFQDIKLKQQAAQEAAKAEATATQAASNEQLRQ